MKQYLDLLRDIKKNGTIKTDRTGTGTAGGEPGAGKRHADHPGAGRAAAGDRLRRCGRRERPDENTLVTRGGGGHAPPRGKRGTSDPLRKEIGNHV